MTQQQRNRADAEAVKGGKPSRSTPADRRLRENRGKPASAPKAPVKPAPKKPFPGAAPPFKPKSPNPSPKPASKPKKG